MIKELRKTYGLLPKLTDEKERKLEITRHWCEGYQISLIMQFDVRPRYIASYTVTHEELLSAKFDYEDYAISTICAIARNQLGEDTDNA